MSQQFINIGYVVNDGTGDTLRDAFEKVNGNFNELFTSTLSGTSLATPNTVVRRDEAAGAAFGKIEFKNEYASPASFPAAASHTGMVAYANSTGREYYSNGSQWLPINTATTSDELPEGSTNLYFTQARARASVTVSGPTWIQYDRNTGVLSFSDLTVSDISDAASISYVDTNITQVKNDILGGVGANLDTLKELADAINADPVFYQTIASGLGTKANIASPTFTGTPAAPTATPGTNTTQLATTAFVTAAVAGKDNTDEITEGSTNLYFTQARARSSISVSGALSYNPSTGVIGYTPGTVAFTSITGLPSTLDGYGITDAYTKSQVDTALSGKVNTSALTADYYTKTQVDTALSGKVNTSALTADYYTKTAVDTLVGTKANASDVYTKTEVYTQQEVDLLIASSLSGGPDTFTKAEVLDLLLNIHNRLNEAGIPDLLGSITSAVVVTEDWGTVATGTDVPNEDYGNLADDVAY